MLEPKPLAENRPYLQKAAGESPDLDQRLGLYRVFLKLYEHHRDLLDEILDLENTAGRCRNRGVWRYIQGGVHGDQAYLTTNLLQEKTCTLYQPQQLWVIGRDRAAGLPVQDKRLSRRHAIVQYIPNQGFYLMDLNSTNGTYVNGEAVRHPVRLQDGDRVRLGSLSFVFFYIQAPIVLESLPSDLFQALNIATATPVPPPEPSSSIEFLMTDGWDIPLEEASLLLSPGEAEADVEDEADMEDEAEVERDTSMFLQPPPPPSDEPMHSFIPELSTDQKAEILDRFLNR